MNKEEFLSTQFSEQDVDDFDMSGLKGGGQEGEKGATGHEDDEGGEGGEGGAGEQDDKGAEGKNQKQTNGGQEAEEAALAEEAKGKGISVEELKELKAEEQEELEAEAEAEGITVEELQDRKAKEAEDAEIKAEAEKRGVSEEEIRKEKEAADKEFDLFDGLESTGDGEVKGKSLDMDFNTVAQNIGLELEEGEKIESQEVFEAKVKQSIENARQKLNLDDYPPEVGLIIENLKKNDNLFVTDWYRNDTIRNADAFLARSDDNKIKSVLASEMKTKYQNAEDLREAVEDAFDEMTEQDIKEKLRTINKDVIKIRNKEINRFLGEKNDWIKKQETADNQRVEKERGELVKKVESMEKFLGFKIPDSAKQVFIKDIKSGAFQKYLDQNAADTKVLAYLASRLGGKLEKGLEKLIAVERNTGYKKGTDTIIKQKHNIRKDTRSGGHQKSKGQRNGLSVDDNYFEE